MKQAKIFPIIVLCIGFVLTTLPVFAQESMLEDLLTPGIDSLHDNRANSTNDTTALTSYPVMRPDIETLRKWDREHKALPSAFIDEDINERFRLLSRQGLGSEASLLDYLSYKAKERYQDHCGNCWVWAGTGIMEIAYKVQENIKQRFSIQFLNSCREDKWACYGGPLKDLADWYATKGFAIPWVNAPFVDQSGARGDFKCSGGESDKGCDGIPTSPRIPIKSITAEGIDTYGFGEEAAINNIKNVLMQRRAIYFGFRLPDFKSFKSKWHGEKEEKILTIPEFTIPDKCGNQQWQISDCEKGIDGGGAHAVLLVGYDDTDPDPKKHYWILLNSWGNADGKRPHGLFRLAMHMNYDCAYVVEGSAEPMKAFVFQTLNIRYVNHDRPDEVKVDPTDHTWPSSPQYVNVSSENANEIYYKLTTSLGGKDPGEPDDPTKKDGIFEGDSGTLKLYAKPGELKKVRVKFRGHNDSGYGPTSGPFTYTIDLTGSSLNPKIAQLPMSGPPGTTFKQWGTGFTPYGTATLRFQKPDKSEYPPITDQQLDNIGHFEIPYKARLDKPLGSYCWWAIDNQTKKQSNTVCYQLVDGTGTVTGRLHKDSANGDPLAGAKVRCGGQDSTSGSDGSFWLSKVPAGNQTLSFSSSGYLDYERPVFIIAGQTLDAGDRWMVKNPPDPSSKTPNLAIHELQIKKSSEDDSELGHTLHLGPGEKFDIKVWIKNRGKTKAKAQFTVKYLLSDDNRITADDREVGEDRDKTDIGAGKTISEWKQKIAAPSIPGTYYVGAWVDSPEDVNKENDFSRGDKERGKILVEIPNQQPDGLLESSTCLSISGWARDPDTVFPIKVDLYADGPAGLGTFLGEVSASAYRSDLPYADRHHGFTFYTPASVKDGKSHTIHAYAIDSTGGTNPLLNGSPMTIACDPPLAPFFKYCAVMAYNWGSSSEMTGLLDATISDPDGWAPYTIASLTVSGPNGFYYNFTPSDYIPWSPGEYQHRIAGLPADGEYSFTVTDINGKTSTSTFYLTVGVVIPVPDSSSFQASGDPLAPTISWSTIRDYPGNLFYRVQIADSTAGVWTSSINYNNTSVTVPSGVLTPGKSYSLKIDAFDNYSFSNSNKRAGTITALSLENAHPYFAGVAAFKIHEPDGSFSTGLFAQGADPTGSVSTLVVTDPQGTRSSPPDDCLKTGSSCLFTLPSLPPDGLYTFIATNADNATATSYFHLSSYDVPSIDPATMRASGDPMAPVLSWSVPAGTERPLYYVANMKDFSEKTVWSSSVSTYTSVTVPEGTVEPGASYSWQVAVYDSPYVTSANRSFTPLKALTVDSSSPYFTYAVAYDRHDPDGNFTALKVRIGVPGGTIPESIASLTVSGPNEMVHSFEPAEYSAGTNEYSHRALDHPQEGLYVFTMTDNNGTTAVTHWYHKNAGGTIPVLDESAFQVSGDPLAPTVSWSGVAGYPAHLYYRLSVIDQEGNSVYLSSYSPNSYRVIPAGRLQSGTSYNYRLEVVDAPYFPGYRHRANSGYHQYPKLSGGKN